MSFRSIKLILTLRCEESSRLMSRCLDEELTFAERIAVAAHQLSCKHCRQFLRQIKSLRQIVRHREADLTREGVLPSSRLTNEARQRIQTVISGASQEEKG